MESSIRQSATIFEFKTFSLWPLAFAPWLGMTSQFRARFIVTVAMNAIEGFAQAFCSERLMLKSCADDV